MPLIKPFAGLRPTTAEAAAVAAPPYDVLSTAEAREQAKGRPWSFLHISKPEIDLPAATDPYAPEVYAKAVENLKAMRAAGILELDSTACYYAYQLQMGEHVQTGLVAAASVADYDSNRIRKHEFTRPDKEDDRVRQIEALGAQTGPVLLAYPASSTADALIAQATLATPVANVTAADGIRHTLWKISESSLIEKISTTFDALPNLYIADGHHRSAAASRVAAAHPNQAEAAYFLAVIFPHHAMQILDYNRVVRDLNGLSAPQFLSALEKNFQITASQDAVHPAQAGEFGMYLRASECCSAQGSWLRLQIKPELIPQNDPVGRLDVSLLSDHLLGPILNITDLRRDKRIDFVGGIRGLKELEKRVDSGEMMVAFALHPTQMHELMAVADAGEVMPPKSTWFEPKLADGLVSHLID